MGNVHVSASVDCYESNRHGSLNSLAQFYLSAIMCLANKVVRPRPKGAAEAEKDLLKSTRLRRPLQVRLV